MQYIKRRKALTAVSVVLCAAISITLFCGFVDLRLLLEKATEYSASVILSPPEQIIPDTAMQAAALPVQTSSEAENNTFESFGEIRAISASGQVTPDEGRLPVIEETRTDSGDIITYNGISLLNKTSHELSSLLTQMPEYAFGGGTVLIFHTHASESYSDTASDSYDPSAPLYSSAPEKTVIAAGNALAESLEAHGIKVIHDTSVFDSPSASGAYLRARTRLDKLLAANPDISVVIDLHRGVIQQTGGARVKPTVAVGDSRAAQISLITGCDADGTVGLPEWKSNLAFAAALQAAMTEYSPLIARPVCVEERKYNFDILPASVTLEIGTDTNTAEEAALSAKLFAEGLANLLEKQPSP